MLSRKVTIGTVWLFATRILSNMIGFIGQLIIARLLLPEDFGIFALAMSTTMVISAMLELPVSMAIIQMPSPSRDDFNTAYTLSVIRGAIVCVVMLALAWPIAMLFHKPDLVSLLAALAFFPLLLGFRNSYFDVFARDVSFTQESMMDLASKGSSFIVSVGVAYFFRSYWAFPAGILCSALAAVAISFALPPARPGFSLKSFRKMWGFSAWLGLRSIVNETNNQADKFIMGWFYPTALLGRYHMGQQIASQFTQVLVYPFTRTLFSGFSQIQTDLPRLRGAYFKAQTLLSVIIVPVGFGTAAVAEPLVLLLLGEEWRQSIFFIQFVAPTLALSAIYAPVGALAMAQARTRTLFLRDTLAMCIRVPMMIIGVVTGGIMGFMCFRVATALIMAVINLFLVKELIGESLVRQAQANMRQFIAAGVMTLATVEVRHLLPDTVAFLPLLLKLSVMGATGALVYAGSLLTLWHYAGRPEGPEPRLLSHANSAVSLLHRRMTRGA